MMEDGCGVGREADYSSLAAGHSHLARAQYPCTVSLKAGCRGMEGAHTETLDADRATKEDMVIARRGWQEE